MALCLCRRVENLAVSPLQQAVDENPQYMVPPEDNTAE